MKKAVTQLVKTAFFVFNTDSHVRTCLKYSILSDFFITRFPKQIS